MERLPIELLGLSVRSYNCLKRNKINTLGELKQLSVDEIFAIKNLGKISAAEIIEVIRKYNDGEIKPIYDLPEDTYTSITENPHHFKKDGNIIQAGMKKVLHYIEEATVLNEVEEVLFLDKSGLLVGDIEVETMELSARAKNTLLRRGHFSVKKLVNMQYDDFIAIKGMGDGSRDEILGVLKTIVQVQYKTKTNGVVMEKLENELIEDIRLHCPKLSATKYSSPIKVALFKNRELIDNNEISVFENKELLNRIYTDKAIYKIFENYICQLLLDNITLSLYALKQKMPEGLCSSDVFMEMIKSLSAQGKIDYTESGLQYHLMTIRDYINMMENGHHKDVLLCRLQGMTLEETGKVIGVTRERVRQIAVKALQKVPKLREDQFKYWFENYDITKDEFKRIFGFDEESYNYLKGTYKKGEKSLEELLEDEHLHGVIAQRALKEMRKYCVIINGEYVPLKRETLVRKLFELNHSDVDCAVSEFYKEYLQFLEDNELITNQKLLYPSERAFEARLNDQRYTLAKYGRRVRFYNIEEYDIDTLFAEMDFSSYDGLEISTLKLMNSYPELMTEYNILDEYELHNLMKKNESKLVQYEVTLGRMPLLSVGVADREKQVIKFLYKVAPIEYYKFGEVYEDKYGVKKETVLANFTTYVDKYYNAGEFSVDYKKMSKQEYSIMSQKLSKDYYLIKDIKHIYHDVFPHEDIEKINPYTLKMMGFSVYVDYVIRNTYSSCDEYFRVLLTSNDVTDLSMLDKSLIYNQSLYFVLENLRVNFEILEFEKNKYVTFERFSKGAQGITKEDLQQYTIEAVDFCDEEFFTIKSIRKKGFVSKLDELGFDEWFYGALLRANKNIRYSKFGGNFLFSHIGRQFKRSDFFLFLMKKLQKIDIVKFIQYIEDEYGLKIDRSDVTMVVNQSNMYYDQTMERIYLNKELFYEDI